MIFRFVVRHGRWLGRVPLLPQIFDAWLLLATALTNREKLRAIELLEERAVELFHATLSVHRFGGVGFMAGDRELGHVHGNGLFDACVGRVNRDVAIAAGMALPHHVFPRSGWVSFWIERESDVERAVELLRMSKQADSGHGDGRVS
ncbi:MAG: luciferase family protein [Chthoniobacterales bacterium]